MLEGRGGASQHVRCAKGARSDAIVSRPQKIEREGKASEESGAEWGVDDKNGRDDESGTWMMVGKCLEKRTASIADVRQTCRQSTSPSRHSPQRPGRRQSAAAPQRPSRRCRSQRQSRIVCRFPDLPLRTKASTTGRARTEPRRTASDTAVPTRASGTHRA